MLISDWSSDVCASDLGRESCLASRWAARSGLAGAGPSVWPDRLEPAGAGSGVEPVVWAARHLAVGGTRTRSGTTTRARLAAPAVARHRLAPVAARTRARPVRQRWPEIGRAHV